MGVTEWWNGWKTWAQAKTSVSSEVILFFFATAAKFGVSGRGDGVGGIYCMAILLMWESVPRFNPIHGTKSKTQTIRGVLKHS